VELCASVLID